MRPPGRRQLLGLAACAAALSVGARGSAASRVLRFSYQRSSALLITLKANHELEDQLAAKGWRVEWALFEDVILPMTSGAVDFNADVADAVPVFTEAAGAPLTFYAREAPSPEAEAIIVHADSPIRGVADLKGRTVAVHRGSGAHYLLAAAVQRSGLSLADLSIAYLPPSTAVSAFDGRSIDAWSIWDPFLAITESKTPTRRLADGRGLTSYMRYYMVASEVAEHHPDVVQIVFDGLVRTGQWVRRHPQEAAAFLAPFWGNIPTKVVGTVNARRSYDVLPMARDGLAEEQKIADLFHQLNLIPRPVDIRSVRLWQPDPTPTRP